MERLSLINYDVVRELCENCRRERFHFVPMGAAPATGACRQCGADSRVVDWSDTAISRLVTRENENGEVVIVPLIAKSA